ncbi:MAG: hypothetical protein JST70_02830 [Bacteroidetes bacterium]|nr:hypothetical protein [Bacteroidota bacterium]
MRKYVLGTFLALSVLTVACKKNKNMINATVVDSGDIANNGCGYLLKLDDDGTLLRPRYMPSAYQHDGMRVKVKLNRDGEGEICNTYPTKKFLEVADLTDIIKNQD